MIRAVDPDEASSPSEPQRPEPADSDDVATLSIAMHNQQTCRWDLLLVMTRERLNKIMQPDAVNVCLFNQIPGLGPVPPACLALLSSLTMNRNSRDRLLLRAQMTIVGEEDFQVFMPVPLRLQDAAQLRKQKIVTFTCGPVFRAHQIPAWDRVEHIVLLYAQTRAEVERLTKKLAGNNDSMTLVDRNDTSYW